MIKENLRTELKEAGFRFKTFKVEHVDEIRKEFYNLKEAGLLDEEIYENYLTGFRFNVSDVLENAKSVIIFAASQSKSIAEFEYNGRLIETVIPPTYIYQKIREQLTAILDKILTKNGYHYKKANLPLKLLAVKSGLGQYGRNNICYVPEIGSFVRLDAFITDYDFEEDSWGDMTVMESCENCSACIAACPTSVIDRERFLIHAENCITKFNENEEPIPEMIKPVWHNAVVGCMKCQEICPQNRELVNQIDKTVHFTEKETESLLNGSRLGDLPADTKIKVASINMEEYYDIFPRNIKLLIK